MYQYISRRRWRPSWIFQFSGLIGHFWAGHRADLDSAPFNTPEKLVCHKLTRFASVMLVQVLQSTLLCNVIRTLSPWKTSRLCKLLLCQLLLSRQIRTLLSRQIRTLSPWKTSHLCKLPLCQLLLSRQIRTLSPWKTSHLCKLPLCHLLSQQSWQ